MKKLLKFLFEMEIEYKRLNDKEVQFGDLTEIELNVLIKWSADNKDGLLSHNKVSGLIFTFFKS